MLSKIEQEKQQNASIYFHNNSKQRFEISRAMKVHNTFKKAQNTLSVVLIRSQYNLSLKELSLTACSGVLSSVTTSFYRISK